MFIYLISEISISENLKYILVVDLKSLFFISRLQNDFNGGLMMAAAVDTDQSFPAFHHCHSDTINSHVQFPQVRDTRNASLFILTLYGEPGACRPRREESKVILKLYTCILI